MCSTCGKRFFAAVSLNKHIRSVHLKKDEEKTKEVVMFNCDHCTVSFPHKFSLGTSIYSVSTFKGEGVLTSVLHLCLFRGRGGKK